jgi:hypothetical protein
VLGVLQGGSERRLPPDGGPDLPRATMPVAQIAMACDHLMVFKVTPRTLRPSGGSPDTEVQLPLRQRPLHSARLS